MTFPANIFVLCTGRCGSTTLARAAGHFSNWTAGHETRTLHIGAARFDYPLRHIEIDNRLSWVLGRLDRVFGDEAAYVHLTRDPEEVAHSFARRAHQGIIRAYRTDILSRSRSRRAHVPMLEYCRDYVATVTANIEAFLKDKSRVLDMRLETIGPDFDRFADWIGAEGDLSAARAELAVRHNASRAAPTGD